MLFTRKIASAWPSASGKRSIRKGTVDLPPNFGRSGRPITYFAYADARGQAFFGQVGEAAGHPLHRNSRRHNFSKAK